MMGLAPCVAMPDEPAWGQFRRLALENGLHSSRALQKLVTEGESRDRWLAVRRQLTFFMSGTARPDRNRTYELGDYFKKHCIFPQLVGLNGWVKHWHDLVFRWAFHHGTHYPSTWVVRSCPECAKEDALQVGFAWYRQGHQLPGVDWCLRHGCSLFQVPTRVDLIRRTNWQSYQVPFTVGKEHPLPPFAHRYLRALEWLRHPVHWSARSEFERQVNGLVFGADDASYEEEREVGVLIERMAPQDWYRTHFVEPLEKLTRPIDSWKEQSNPGLALKAAYSTTSDAEVDELLSKTKAGLDAIDESLRQWRKSGGVSTSE